MFYLMLKNGSDRLFGAEFISLFAVFLSNAIVFGVAEYFGVYRPLVNVDYVLVIALLSFGFFYPSILLLIIFVFSDFMNVLGQVFTFIRPSDLFSLISYLPYTSDYYKWAAFFLLFLMAFLIVVTVWLGERGGKKTSIFLFNFFILSLAYQAQVYKDDSKYYRVDPGLVVISQLNFLITQRLGAFTSSVFEDVVPLEEYSGSSAVRKVGLDRCCEGFSDKILLIVNESWGVGINQSADQYLLSLIRQESENVEYGVFSFGGATVAAELRELCSLSPTNYNLTGVYQKLEQCLPHKLKGEGYPTQAIHGAVSHMYDRKNWYPQAGFEKVIFQENLIKARRCYSYPGACDIDTIALVENFFLNESKGFLYWLTLNTHARYDSRDILIDNFDCQRFSIDSDEVCRYFKLQSQFFHALGQSISAGNLDGVDILIVGDHEPRLTDQSDLEKYFITGKVPWVRVKIPE